MLVLRIFLLFFVVGSKKTTCLWNKRLCLIDFLFKITYPLPLGICINVLKSIHILKLIGLHGMAIQKNSVVSLHYEMFDANDQLLDKTEQPIVYLHGGYDGIFPLVEEALHGKEVGDVVDVVLAPDDAFGEQDPELVRIEDVNVFPVEVEVGMMFEADDPETGDVWVYRVTDVADGKAVVDGNHPLAGMKIRFKATVESVRDAEPEEIEHGHVHGEHGHHH